MPYAFDRAQSIKRYCINLRETIGYKSFEITHDFDNVIEKIFEVMSRKNKHVPIIIENDNFNCQQVLLEMVALMDKGKVPATFSSRDLISLDFNALFDEASDENDSLLTIDNGLSADNTIITGIDTTNNSLERLILWPTLQKLVTHDKVLNRLRSIFLEIAQAPEFYILYIDHFYRLMGVKVDDFSFDASTLLKPALARDHLPLLGSCTLEQYNQYISKDIVTRHHYQKIDLTK